VQNYIDNTGVQVADVVVGLVHLEGKTLESTRELLTELMETNTLIDYYCWTSTRGLASGMRAPVRTIPHRRRG